jgi:hypothetical protein
LKAWRAAFSDRAFRFEVGITLAACPPVFVVAMRMLERVETRPGAVLSDPVHALFAPIDVTWLTFALIYTSLLTAMAVIARDPPRFLFGLQAYLLLTLLRCVTLWLVPLEPPAGIIPLRDPFVQGMVGTTDVLLKDLFFSGHTSLPFLVFLVARTRGFKLVFLFLSLGIGALVILQHVHYTIDVVAAPAASYVAYRLWRLCRPRAV